MLVIFGPGEGFGIGADAGSNIGTDLFGALAGETDPLVGH